MVAELEGVMPVTIPELLIDALPGTVLLHVPPGVGLVSAVCDPAQTLVAPVIAAGLAFTVAIIVT